MIIVVFAFTNYHYIFFMYKIMWSEHCHVYSTWWNVYINASITVLAVFWCSYKSLIVLLVHCFEIWSWIHHIGFSLFQLAWAGSSIVRSWPGGERIALALFRSLLWPEGTGINFIGWMHSGTNLQSWARREVCLKGNGCLLKASLDVNLFFGICKIWQLRTVSNLSLQNTSYMVS